MPAKYCLVCNTSLVLKIKRDLTRKKYCSRKCLGVYTGKNRSKESMDHMRKTSCTPEANLKKVHLGEKHPRYKKDRTTIKSPRPRYENTKWSRAIFERDNYTCQFCNKRGGENCKPIT